MGWQMFVFSWFFCNTDIYWSIGNRKRVLYCPSVSPFSGKSSIFQNWLMGFTCNPPPICILVFSGSVSTMTLSWTILGLIKSVKPYGLLRKIPYLWVNRKLFSQIITVCPEWRYLFSKGDASIVYVSGPLGGVKHETINYKL